MYDLCNMDYFSKPFIYTLSLLPTFYNIRPA